MVAVPLLPGAAHAVPGQTKDASVTTPVSSPIREFGILKVEHGDVRVAARAAPWRTVRPDLTSRTTRVAAEAREEHPEIALRVGGAGRRGGQGEH